MVFHNTSIRVISVDLPRSVNHDSELFNRRAATTWKETVSGDGLRGPVTQNLSRDENQVHFGLLPYPSEIRLMQLPTPPKPEIA